MSCRSKQSCTDLQIETVNAMKTLWQQLIEPSTTLVFAVTVSCYYRTLSTVWKCALTAVYELHIRIIAVCAVSVSVRSWDILICASCDSAGADPASKLPQCPSSVLLLVSGPGKASRLPSPQPAILLILSLLNANNIAWCHNTHHMCLL